MTASIVADTATFGVGYTAIGEPTLTASLSGTDPTDLLILQVVAYLDDSTGAADMSIGIESEGWTPVANLTFSPPFGTPPRSLRNRLLVAWRRRGTATDIELSVTPGVFNGNNADFRAIVWAVSDTGGVLSTTTAPPFPSNRLPVAGNQGRAGMAVVLATGDNTGTNITNDVTWTKVVSATAGSDQILLHKLVGVGGALTDIEPAPFPPTTTANTEGVSLAVGMFLTDSGLFPQVAII